MRTPEVVASESGSQQVGSSLRLLAISHPERRRVGTSSRLSSRTRRVGSRRHLRRRVSREPTRQFSRRHGFRFRLTSAPGGSMPEDLERLLKLGRTRRGPPTSPCSAAGGTGRRSPSLRTSSSGSFTSRGAPSRSAATRALETWASTRGSRQGAREGVGRRMHHQPHEERPVRPGAAGGRRGLPADHLAGAIHPSLSGQEAMNTADLTCSVSTAPGRRARNPRGRPPGSIALAGNHCGSFFGVDSAACGNRRAVQRTDCSQG
jgi:hypothetical protein